MESQRTGKTEDIIIGWKAIGLRLLNWLYTTIPISSEFLSIHTKTVGILSAWHLVSRNGTAGDYCEFGVFRGDTFKLSLRAARNSFRTSPSGNFQGRFLAFDSFQGLPDAQSLSEEGNIFKKGEYACSRDLFLRRIQSAVGNSEVRVVEGWFKDKLTESTRKELHLEKIAVAYIDCDLYESTSSVLEFITPAIATGTILIFDDWFMMQGSMKRGEAKAAEEWLKKNPSIRLVPYQKCGIGGMIFIVNISDSEGPFYHVS